MNTSGLRHLLYGYLGFSMLHRQLVATIYLAASFCLMAAALPEGAVAGSKFGPIKNYQLEAQWNFAQTNFKNAIPKVEFPYHDTFVEASRETGIPYSILVALARGESDFQAKASSRLSQAKKDKYGITGCYGVMQICWPGTAQELGLSYDELFVPETNIMAGAAYLRKKLIEFDGNYYLAIAAYNYGGCNVKRQVFQPLRGGRLDCLSDAPLKRRASVMSEGAHGYSQYIYDHLEHVVGYSQIVDDIEPMTATELARASAEIRRHVTPTMNYGDFVKIQLTSFEFYYQAKLEERSITKALHPYFGNEVHLEVFANRNSDRYTLLLQATDEEDLARKKEALCKVTLFCFK